MDFLGVGSKRALGPKMRRVEERIFCQAATLDSSEGRGKIMILGEVEWPGREQGPEGDHQDGRGDHDESDERRPALFLCVILASNQVQSLLR